MKIVSSELWMSNYYLLPIESVDRISALPDEIIHSHILYRLKAPKQVARTSVLSRRWLQLWRSYPVLEFDEKEEPRRTGKKYLDDHASFAAASARRLSMYYQNCRMPLDSLRISLPINCSRSFCSLLASALASDYGSPLEVVIQGDSYFALPPVSLSTCSRTKALKLILWRGLERLVLRQPMSSLQVLNLVYIKLREAHVLYYIVANTPTLETLTLEECNLEFDKLEISASNFRRLKTLEIQRPSISRGGGLADPLRVLELQLTTAPFLERLIVSEHWNRCEYKAASSSSAPNLKVLRIRIRPFYCIRPSNRNLDDFIAKLPALEVMEISPDVNTAANDVTGLHLNTCSTPCLRVMDVSAVRKLGLQIISAECSSRVKVLNLRVPEGFNQGHLDDVISKLPCLESLCLMITGQFKSSNSKMSKMRVSIHQLQAFQLRDCAWNFCVRVPEEMALPELELDTPNLVSVRIDTHFRLPAKVNIVNVPPGCRFVVGGRCLPDDTVSWFLLLKKFLSALSPFHLVLRWGLRCLRASFDLSRVECTSPPLIIEHLQLEMGLMFRPPSAQQVRTILDGLFWACRPKLYCITDKFMHKQLKYKDHDVVAKCCIGEKCWQHELIDAKIENVSYVDRKPFNLFVNEADGIFKVSSPMITHVKTCFVLTWR